MQTVRPDFRKQLHEHGFRATSERIRLLEILWSAKHPLTVDEIKGKLGCNLVTVYRALDDLCHAGLVLRGVGSGHVRAAHFSSSRSDHHHHLTCIDCGFTRECTVCA